MIEILPNWHPFLVHFTIALFFTATGFFVAARVFAGKAWSGGLLTAGRWNLWLGAVMTLGTIAAGFYAYNTVAHDTPSHAAMTDHRNWAVLTAVALVILAFWSFWQRKKEASIIFIALLVVATGALGVTGFKGGEAVYRYGLGVMSLPEAEGEGHAHEHAAGEEHDTPATTDGDADAAAKAQAEHDATPHEHGDEDDDAAAVTGGHSHAAPDSALAALQAFHHALTEGNRADIEALLAADVVIYERGNVEASRAEYAGHHMGADMAFLKEMQEETLSQAVHESDGLVWIISQTRTTGTFNGNDIDSTGTETAILEQRDGIWQIVHLHWS